MAGNPGTGVPAGAIRAARRPLPSRPSWVLSKVTCVLQIPSSFSPTRPEAPETPGERVCGSTSPSASTEMWGVV